MGISIIDNFDYRAGKPNFTRDLFERNALHRARIVTGDWSGTFYYKRRSVSASIRSVHCFWMGYLPKIRSARVGLRSRIMAV